MPSIVKSDGVRAELTRYAVDGWGDGELWTAGSVVLAHDFHFRFTTETADESVRGPAGELVSRIRAFFAARQVRFDDVRIDLDSATPFQRAVVRAIRGIPHGEIASYGEIAALAGYPNAGRAVGNVCAHNAWMLIVPCHRVVAADGIGSYGSAGIDVKRRLLRLEGVEL
jgi:methylated-DNA-[protein]-cysteine S-methyltransferase